MKHLLLPFLLLPVLAFSQQQDTTKIEQYCQLSFYEGMGHFKVDVLYGDQFKYPNETILDKLEKNPKVYKSWPAVLNAMGMAGWKMIPVFKHEANSYWIAYFKKEMNRADVQVIEQ